MNPYFNIPNGITVLRMAGSLFLLFVRPFSPVFFMLYTFTGFTDLLDGWIARRTGSAGRFGARLDSIADLIFYASVWSRIFPALWKDLPAEIWYAFVAILILRLSAYLVSALKYRKCIFLHTYLNKLSGAAVFLVPYVMSLPFAIPACWAICAIAAVSAGEELLIQLCRREVHADIKSLFD